MMLAVPTEDLTSLLVSASIIRNSMKPWLHLAASQMA